MKKLKLEIDALEVESFDAGGTLAYGTVEGMVGTPDCDSVHECKLTVQGTYDASCALACTGSCQYTNCANAQTCGGNGVP